MTSFIIVCEYEGNTNISECVSNNVRDALLQWASYNKMKFCGDEIAEIEDEVLFADIASIKGINGCYCCALLCKNKMLLLHIIERRL